MIPIRLMRTGENLLDHLASILAQLGLAQVRHAALIHDHVLTSLVEEMALPRLRKVIPQIDLIPLGSPGEGLDSDLPACNQAANAISTDVQLCIGVGSGVISDITKWAATKRNLPYGLIGTAPSMNAYTSITATITEGDIKVSRYLNPPDFVLLDHAIMRTAPSAMVQAGLGDLAARAVCNADWKLGEFLGGSRFCSVPFQLTAPYESEFLRHSLAIRINSPEASRSLAEAIMISGLSMTMMDGETSPSSGAEHILSHFWDLLSHLRGLPKNLHGSQVGIGTILVLTLYQVLQSFDFSAITPGQALQKRPSLAALEESIRSRYGRAAPQLLEVVAKKWIPDDSLPAYIHNLQAQWGAIQSGFQPFICDPAVIRIPLEQAGVDFSLASLRRSREEALEALTFGPHYRPRYSILDLCFNFGVLEEFASETLRTANL